MLSNRTDGFLLKPQTNSFDLEYAEYEEDDWLHPFDKNTEAIASAGDGNRHNDDVLHHDDNDDAQGDKASLLQSNLFDDTFTQDVGGELQKSKQNTHSQAEGKKMEGFAVGSDGYTTQRCDLSFGPEDVSTTQRIKLPFHPEDGSTNYIESGNLCPPLFVMPQLQPRQADDDDDDDDDDSDGILNFLDSCASYQQNVCPTDVMPSDDLKYFQDPLYDNNTPGVVVVSTSDQWITNQDSSNHARVDSLLEMSTTLSTNISVQGCNPDINAVPTSDQRITNQDLLNHPRIGSLLEMSTTLSNNMSAQVPDPPIMIVPTSGQCSTTQQHLTNDSGFNTLFATIEEGETTVSNGMSVPLGKLVIDVAPTLDECITKEDSSNYLGLLSDAASQLYNFDIQANFSDQTTIIQYKWCGETAFAEELETWNLETFMFHGKKDTLIQKCLSYFQRAMETHTPNNMDMQGWKCMQTLSHMNITMDSSHRSMLQSEKRQTLDLTENDHILLELFCKKLSTDIHHRVVKNAKDNKNKVTEVDNSYDSISTMNVEEVSMASYTNKLCAFIQQPLGKKISRSKINSGMLAVFIQVLKMTDCLQSTLAYLFHAIVKVEHPLRCIVGVAMSRIFDHMYRAVHVTTSNHTSAHVLAMLSDHVAIATLTFNVNELWAIDNHSMLPVQLAYVNMLHSPNDKQILTFLFLYVKTFMVPNAVILGALSEKVSAVKDVAEKLLAKHECIVKLEKTDYPVRMFKLPDREVRIVCNDLVMKAIDSIKNFPNGEIDLCKTLIDMKLERDLINNFYLKSKMAQFPTVLHIIASKFCRTHASNLTTLGFMSPKYVSPVFQSLYWDDNTVVELVYPRHLTTYSSLYAYLNLESNFQTNDDILLLYRVIVNTYNTRVNSSSEQKETGKRKRKHYLFEYNAEDKFKYNKRV